MSQTHKHDIMLAVLVAALMVVLLLLLWPQLRPSPLPPPTDDAWARIQAAGRIVVGTAADHPPFASYDDNFALTGFDIALMREIGQKLGVQVEFKDMAFDGLGSALALNQVDAAISAMPVTLSRDQVMDFSNVYFQGEDAVLARQESSLTVNALNDLSPYRVGVQEAAIYQNVIQRQLVATGAMLPQNLFVYKQADTAVAALSAGDIDLVLLDLQPAQVAVNLNGFKIVGQGIVPQAMAVAVKNGEWALQARLNEALAALQREGRIAQLVLDYMDIPPGQPPPLPTAVAATPIPAAPTPPCIPGMKFVLHLSLDDDTMQNPPAMLPGTPFQKGWRVQNTGTCAWSTDDYLLYVDGNTPMARMGGQAAYIQHPVQPGEAYDIWVNLVSPLVPGTYQGLWVMHQGPGRQFGDRIRVGIEALPLPTLTPRPTQTPAPTIQFTVDRSPINAGECVTFSWDVMGATAVYFYAASQNWQQHQVSPQGSRRECPSLTTYYELRVLRSDGTPAIREIFMPVIPVPDAPVIEQFILYPPDDIFAGQCITVSWRVLGSVSSVTLLRNDGVIHPHTAVSGFAVDCPPVSGTVVYSLVANGPNGRGRQQQTLRVVLPSAPPPPPTATPPAIPPAIQAFNVYPGQIELAACVAVSWRISGQAALIQLKRDGLIVLDNAGYSGTVNDCLQTPGTITYRVEASNQAGGFAFQETAVLVRPAP